MNYYEVDLKISQKRLAHMEAETHLLLGVVIVRA